MKNVAIIYGGRSVEHDISILTALHAKKHVSEDVNVILVYLTRENKMVVGRCLENIDFYIDGKGRVKDCWFRDSKLFIGKRSAKIDVVINCCHGGVGERGEVAAMLNVSGIPITSSNFFAAGKMMSKTATRDILLKNKFLQPKYSISGKNISFPVIVKPDGLGSSIGINIANNEEELKSAIELALNLDNKVIVEEYLQNAMEINCSAFRLKEKIWVSECEVVNEDNEGLFDFATKYLNSGSGFIKKSGKDEPEIDEKLNKVFDEIKKQTQNAYEIFNASGVVRADFLVVGYPERPRIYLNEINTVPGFLSYHMWMRAGIPYTALLDMVIKQAISELKMEKITVYKSDILEKNRKLVD